jgi:hypothetical protein
VEFQIAANGVGVEFETAGARAPRQQGEDGPLEVTAAPAANDEAPGLLKEQTSVAGLGVGALADDERAEGRAAERRSLDDLARPCGYLCLDTSFWS